MVLNTRVSKRKIPPATGSKVAYQALNPRPRNKPTLGVRTKKISNHMNSYETALQELLVVGLVRPTRTHSTTE